MFRDTQSQDERFFSGPNNGSSSSSGGGHDMFLDSSERNHPQPEHHQPEAERYLSQLSDGRASFSYGVVHYLRPRPPRSARLGARYGAPKHTYRYFYVVSSSDDKGEADLLSSSR